MKNKGANSTRIELYTMTLETNNGDLILLPKRTLAQSNQLKSALSDEPELKVIACKFDWDRYNIFLKASKAIKSKEIIPDMHKDKNDRYTITLITPNKQLIVLSNKTFIQKDQLEKALKGSYELKIKEVKKGPTV